MSKKVVVGMSGGVDSSVTALLLKQQGYEVIGLFMKNWDDDDGVCSAAVDYEDVVQVCRQLDIPHYAVNFAKEYWEKVFAHCLKEYAAGHTPNPDILCNREIKFKLFFEKAVELGADYLATGHYCRHLERASMHLLGCGLDPNKDQSYFLYTLQAETLARVLFPLGDLKKSAVRALASAHNLSTARKKDSTGICFIGKRAFRPFLQKYLPTTPGDFETPEGKIMGRHEGIAYYTLGQRKGMGIGGQRNGTGDAWYVVGKDMARNVVTVVQGENHPALWSTGLTATETSWVNAPPTPPFRCEARIRYRSPAVACTIHSLSPLTVTFDAPQKAVTPRQSVVFYSGDVCLGGALIGTS